MAGMLIGFVEHPQAHRRKGLGQLLRNGFLNAGHRGSLKLGMHLPCFYRTSAKRNASISISNGHACLTESVKLARRAEFSA
jgi:hypothetical protein